MTFFFNVTDIDHVLSGFTQFPQVQTESVDTPHAGERILACDLKAPEPVPGFNRSTVDGYAVSAQATFGASDSAPAYLSIAGHVVMGQPAPVPLPPVSAFTMPTGGMLPPGSDAVVMIEHTTPVDDTMVAVHRSVAPGQNMIKKGEDVDTGEVLLKKGTRLRPQDIGLVAALGMESVVVYNNIRIAIISTGDEVVPIHTQLNPGQVRDINSYSLSAMVSAMGGVPVPMGIVPDQADTLKAACMNALGMADIILISGGSSVGTRDITLDVLSALPDAEVMVHGMAISPGKPTIFAKTGSIPVWGLPGHATSAMVVFHAVIAPLIRQMSGEDGSESLLKIPAVSGRNIPSVLGRDDFIRVKISHYDETTGLPVIEPVFGKSGLIRTMVEAHGLIRIHRDTEGIDAGARVNISLFSNHYL